jgi:hypothetical protein
MNSFKGLNIFEFLGAKGPKPHSFLVARHFAAAQSPSAAGYFSRFAARLNTETIRNKK